MHSVLTVENVHSLQCTEFAAHCLAEFGKQKHIHSYWHYCQYVNI